uniref:Uncharacterized protein n=1 Tax=Anguilla anguilla TaxID=7936 RepID=A0A0E9X9S3_ANGAN
MNTQTNNQLLPTPCVSCKKHEHEKRTWPRLSRKTLQCFWTQLVIFNRNDFFHQVKSSMFHQKWKDIFRISYMQFDQVPCQFRFRHTYSKYYESELVMTCTQFK